MMIYVAGPISAEDASKRLWNRIQATQIAYQLRKQGNIVLCPHEQSFFGADCMDEKGWLCHDLWFLERSHMCVLCPRWETSHGTLLEIDFCRERGIPVKVAVTTESGVDLSPLDLSSCENLWSGKLDDFRRSVARKDSIGYRIDLWIEDGKDLR